MKRFAVYFKFDGELGITSFIECENESKAIRETVRRMELNGYKLKYLNDLEIKQID